MAHPSFGVGSTSLEIPFFFFSLSTENSVFSQQSCAALLFADQEGLQPVKLELPGDVNDHLKPC